MKVCENPFFLLRKKAKTETVAGGGTLLAAGPGSTLWMKFSTLVCRPHHLNLTVTSLYAHMWGHSDFSSFCEDKTKAEHPHPPHS